MTTQSVEFDDRYWGGVHGLRPGTAYASALPALSWPHPMAAAAALACLQPGIDPVYLSLLSQSAGVEPEHHGWIVGVAQAGSALGALAVWRAGDGASHSRAVLAGSLAAVAMLLAASTTSLPALLLLRGLGGLGLGVVYATAMTAVAGRQANAWAVVFLLQLVASTLVSALLPSLADHIGEDHALQLLALVPALAAAALAHGAQTESAAPLHRRSVDAVQVAVPLRAWSLAWATFAFICATMMVWSCSCQLALGAGFDEKALGRAVATGSIAGAVTALIIMRGPAVVPLPLTALLVSGALASPLVLTRPGADLGFLAGIVLLNIGSTAIIIRCSALASAASLDTRFRTFVACTHGLGMSAGPALAAGSQVLMDDLGLVVGTLAVLFAGLVAIGFGYRTNS